MTRPASHRLTVHLPESSHRNTFTVRVSRWSDLLAETEPRVRRCCGRAGRVALPDEIAEKRNQMAFTTISYMLEYYQDYLTFKTSEPFGGLQRCRERLWTRIASETASARSWTRRT